MSAQFSLSLTSVILCLGLAVTSTASPTVDLSTAGSSGSVNGALFEQYTTTHGTGTGHFDTFLVLQQHGNSGQEEAYNTDWSPLPLDAKEPAHTNALLLSEVPTVERNGTLYREFVLDIHQDAAGSDRYLSLDYLMVGLGNTPSPSGEVSGVFANTVYTLNSSTSDNWILLNSALSSGGGQGDMLALIPNSCFANATGEYVYLYSKFGVHNAANATPEEWSVRSGGNIPVPAPAAVLLAGLGLGFVGLLRRNRWL